MVTIRAGNVKLLNSVIKKAIATALAGYRCVIIVEMGQTETGNDKEAGIKWTVPRELQEKVQQVHLMHFPAEMFMCPDSCRRHGI